MRGAVLGSVTIHVLTLVVLFLMRGPTPIVVPGPEVMQVALVSPDSPIVPAIQAPAPTPPPRQQPAVAPEKGEGVKLAPPKPKKAEPEPKKEPPPPSAAPALPSATVGTAGLRGQISVDSRDFEFTYYLILVRNRVAQNWTPPAGLGGGSTMQAVAYFQIGRDGSVRALRLETPSGLEYFDRSVTRAIMLSDPLPPLPLGFTGGSLGVHFGFEWGGP